MVESLLEVIKESEGRFLKKSEASKAWFEVDDRIAKEKVSHALRDYRNFRQGRKQSGGQIALRPPNPSPLLWRYLVLDTLQETVKSTSASSSASSPIRFSYKTRILNPSIGLNCVPVEKRDRFKTLLALVIKSVQDAPNGNKSKAIQATSEYLKSGAGAELLETLRVGLNKSKAAVNQATVYDVSTPERHYVGEVSSPCTNIALNQARTNVSLYTKHDKASSRNIALGPAHETTFKRGNVPCHTLVDRRRKSTTEWSPFAQERRNSLAHRPGHHAE